MSLLAPWPNTNRICRSTATNNASLLGLVLFFLLTGCTSVRPVVKIGLIAPFEGLYRQSGYAALAAMRQALAECTPPGVNVIPLALDDSGDPAQARRAAQKLLVDPAVRAVVGPFLLDTIPAVMPVLTAGASVAWIAPPLVDPQGGFADPSSSAWLEAQVEYVAHQTKASRVLLLGLPAEWQLPVNSTTPTLRVDKVENAIAAIDEGDVLLWLGRPEIGARWLSALRREKQTIEFWLADQAGIEIFAAHHGDHSGIYSLIWTNNGYNQVLRSDEASGAPGDATGTLSYRATCTVLSTLDNRQTFPVTAWDLQIQPLAPPSSEQYR